jgi:hypothetical protein
MREISSPPFGYSFDADELAKLYHDGASADQLARMGMPQTD